MPRVAKVGNYNNVAHGYTTTTPLVLDRTIPGNELNPLEGDLLLAAVAAYASVTFTPPAGFNLIRASNSNNITLETYYKWATASEPSTYSFSLSSGAWAVGMMWAFRYVNPAHPLDAGNGESRMADSTCRAPSVNTSCPTGAWFAAHAYRYIAEAYIVYPADSEQNVRNDYGYWPLGAGIMLLMCENASLGATGATGNKDASISPYTANNHGHMLTLQPQLPRYNMMG